ncbi:MAG: hypothetical protein ACYC27_16725 [Armatimonadota bacterium]
MSFVSDSPLGFSPRQDHLYDIRGEDHEPEQLCDKGLIHVYDFG